MSAPFASITRLTGRSKSSQGSHSCMRTEGVPALCGARRRRKEVLVHVVRSQSNAPGCMQDAAVDRLPSYLGARDVVLISFAANQRAEVPICTLRELPPARFTNRSTPDQLVAERLSPCLFHRMRSCASVPYDCLPRPAPRDHPPVLQRAYE